MLRFASLAALVIGAGCSSDDALEDLPIEPMTPLPPTSVGGTTNRIDARVCISIDLRAPAVCATRDVSGLVVSAGGQTTVTNSAGDFTIDVPAADPSVTISGPDVIPTTVAVQPSNALRIIPVVDEVLFSEMLFAAGIAPAIGTGSIIASLTSNGVPVVGSTVSTLPASPFGPFFDGDTPVNWGIDGTGQRGVVWVPGLQTGRVDMVFTNGGVETQVAGITVRNGGITILDTSNLTTGF